MKTDCLEGRIVRGSAWSIFAEVLTSGGRALSYFAYAKLLSPDDFGLVGFCLLWINAFPLLVDNSLSIALVSDKDSDRCTYSTFFFINLGVSVLGIFLLVTCSGLAVHVLHDDRVVYVLPAMGLQVLLNSLSATHIAIARKTFQFRKLVPVRVCSTLVSVILGLGMAFSGFGYWSLVASTVTYGFVQVVVSWATLPFRPALTFDTRKARDIMRFASWVSLDMGVTWAVMSGGGFFLAFYLGTHDLGFFRLADQLDVIILGTLFNPLLPVFYSAFCEVAVDRTRGISLYKRLNSTVSILTLSLTGVIVTLAWPLEKLIGAKWNGLAILIAINVVADAFSYLTGLAPNYLRAQGGARIVAAVRLFMLAGQVVIYFLVARNGLLAFVVGKLALEGIMYVVTYVVLSRGFGVPSASLIGEQATLGAVVTVTALAGVAAGRLLIPLSPLGALVSGPTVFALLFGLVLTVWKKPALIEMFAAIRAGRAAARPG